MTNKQTKKAKRPLQTSLGKAPGHSDKEDMDLSHVKKPIDTSIFGLRQVLSLYQTATEEVKNYITYECDVMYECRICRTIFRSLANFILHKRNYCRAKFKVYTSSCRSDTLNKIDPPEPPEERKVDEGPKSLHESSQWDKTASASKGLTPVIEKLKEQQEIKQLTQELLTTDLSSTPKKSQDEGTVAMISDNDLLLEEIATNNAAVFQTVLQSIPQSDIGKPELMKNEVMEIHGILNSDEVVLGSDGKICKFQTNKLNANTNPAKNYFLCTECNMKFSTKKTLTFHLKNKHNNTRLVYVCPDCKDTFANAWCVYRHLYKVHRKTSAQVKRLREQVHNSVIRKDEDTNKKNDKKESSNLDKADEENQWLNNIEGDNDFQMCGGCGKRFERKAALHSHAAMCTKRIAVCNTIKENNAKKKEEESKDSKSKSVKSDKLASPESTENVLKGASKRKPYLLRTYKQTSSLSLSSCSNGEVNSSSESKIPPTEICDMNERVPNCDKLKLKKDSCDDDLKTVHCTKNFYGTISRGNSCDDRTACEFNEGDKMVHVVCDDSSSSKDNCDNQVVERTLRSSSKEKNCSCPSPVQVDPEKMLNLIGIVPNERIELIKEEISFPKHLEQKSKKTREFDLLCQKVAEHLLKIQDDTTEKSTTPPIEESCAKIPGSPRNAVDFQSPGKISIRSLEELRGFPKENETLDEDMPVLEPSVSPKTPKRSPRRFVKRKRTTSLDSDRKHKTFKQSNFDILLDKQDLNFMAKASPFMDRPSLTCKSCHLKHPSLSKLLWHMSAHFSWFRFQCSRCSFVSFGKAECATHAKEIHIIKQNEIPSVVLPIPNWKTLLMSNEFRELKNEDELGGKLTDEVKSSFQNDTPTMENNENGESKSLIDTLFVDSEADTVDFSDIDDIQSFPMPIVDGKSCIKNESIDIDTNNANENFQVEVPHEIYTLDVFEVINIDERDEDRRRPTLKEEVEDNDFVITNCSSESPEMNDAHIEVDHKNVSNNLVNIRPTRNRMRSIKTLQNDFFYDLGRVTAKPPEVVAKTNGPQKLKRNNASSSVSKKEREMRVYTKNK